MFLSWSSTFKFEYPFVIIHLSFIEACCRIEFIYTQMQRLTNTMMIKLYSTFFFSQLDLVMSGQLALYDMGFNHFQESAVNFNCLHPRQVVSGKYLTRLQSC